MYLIGASQLVFLHVNNFITKKVKHYRLINKSLGYWVEMAKGDRLPTDIYEWDRAKTQRLEKNVLSIRYKGTVYLKVLKSDSYFLVNKRQVSWLDILILVVLIGTTCPRDSSRTQ